ncbi:arginase family protein [Mitsuokella sp.]|uniref:arginase family protein n=1 Tax=Mitsuokella sp. TaxID=2049034 RepID=UPI003D7F0186
MSKTIRLQIGDWQAGAKTAYYKGSQLLSMLAPENPNQKHIVVPIDAPTDVPLKEENGVTAQQAVLGNVQRAKAVIQKEQPDRIITLGGNCLVSQAPFDYLHGKYGETLGVIWFDAHPDISNPQMFNHEHAMVVANLLGAGDPVLHAEVEHPLRPAQILYAGLQPLLASEAQELHRLGVTYTVQEHGMLPTDAILTWLKQHHFSKVAVHWDIDVLSPDDFHAQYFAEPDVPMFAGSSHGISTIREMSEKLQAIQQAADIVGLTIAEYLPWDAIRLQQTMQGLDIFTKD